MMNVNIPKRPITDILGLGFLTGSRVLGGWKEESDWDIVVSILNKQEAINIIEPHSSKIEPSEYFMGITYYITDNKGFHYFTHKINLIFVHPNEYAAWYYATVALSGILKDADIKDKTSRVLLFETLKVQLRDKLPQMYAKRRDEVNEKLTMSGALHWAAPFLETFIPGATLIMTTPLYKKILFKHSCSSCGCSWEDEEEFAWGCPHCSPPCEQELDDLRHRALDRAEDIMSKSMKRRIEEQRREDNES